MPFIGSLLWPRPPAPLLSLLAKTRPSGPGASSRQKPEKQGCQLCVEPSQWSMTVLVPPAPCPLEFRGEIGAFLCAH